MNNAIRQTAETPWERAKDGTDRPRRHCCFRRGRAEMANAMIEQSGMRVAPRPQPRPLGGHQSDRPFRAGEPARLRRRLEFARGTAALQDRGAGRKAAHHHHAQRVARHLLRPLDQPLSRLRAWLRLLLRAADPCLYGPVAGARFRIEAVRQAGRGEAARKGAVARTATSRAPSPSAPTPIPTSRSRSSTASCARSWKCSTRATIRSASSPSRRW